MFFYFCSGLFVKFYTGGILKKNLSAKFIFGLIVDILHEDLRAFEICRRLRDKNEKYTRVREAKESV
jgi:hypothetical protein